MVRDAGAARADTAGLSGTTRLGDYTGPSSDCNTQRPTGFIGGFKGAKGPCPLPKKCQSRSFCLAYAMRYKFVR